MGRFIQLFNNIVKTYFFPSSTFMDNGISTSQMLAYLEIIVALEVLAGFKETSVKLLRLRTGITLHPEEHVFLDLSWFDVRAVHNEVPQRHFSQLRDFFFGEHSAEHC